MVIFFLAQSYVQLVWQWRQCVYICFTVSGRWKACLFVRLFLPDSFVHILLMAKCRIGKTDETPKLIVCCEGQNMKTVECFEGESRNVFSSPNISQDNFCFLWFFSCFSSVRQGKCFGPNFWKEFSESYSVLTEECWGSRAEIKEIFSLDIFCCCTVVKFEHIFNCLLVELAGIIALVPNQVACKHLLPYEGNVTQMHLHIYIFLLNILTS